MQYNTKQINIKNRPCYLFNDMINDAMSIKNFDPSLLEMNKLSFKVVFSVDIQYIKYIPTKSLGHPNIDNDKDFLYLVNADRYIEKRMELSIQYLLLQIKIIKNWKELWNETKSQIEAINDDDDANERIRYRKDLMKIRFESYDKFSLDKKT